MSLGPADVCGRLCDFFFGFGPYGVDTIEVLIEWLCVEESAIRLGDTGTGGITVVSALRSGLPGGVGSGSRSRRVRRGDLDFEREVGL